MIENILNDQFFFNNFYNNVHYFYICKKMYKNSFCNINELNMLFTIKLIF